MAVQVLGSSCSRNRDQERPRVYFDTNALNVFCDEFKTKSKRLFKNYEILLSWPLLDEILSTPSHIRTADLADFIWRVSNRKILVPVDRLVLLEVESLLQEVQVPISKYFSSDESHMTALREARNASVPSVKRDFIKLTVERTKKQVRQWERHERQVWLSEFGPEKSLPNDWNMFYPLLLQERYLNQALYAMIKAFGIANKFAREVIMNLDCRKLRCTSIGIDFWVALQFLTNSQSRKLGKPDRGDFLDIQHAFYVGICDYFVTNDPRVYYILHHMVVPKRCHVMKVESFYHEMTSSLNKPCADEIFL